MSRSGPRSQLSRWSTASLALSVLGWLGCGLAPSAEGARAEVARLIRELGHDDFEVREDGRGLFVKGRLLLEVLAAREAHVLLQAGAIDGLSIGYRTLRAEKAGGQRLLHEIELWEVSLVTFPMLPEARVRSDPSDLEAGLEADLARTLAETFREAREMLA